MLLRLLFAFNTNVVGRLLAIHSNYGADLKICGFPVAHFYDYYDVLHSIRLIQTIVSCLRNQ